MGDSYTSATPMRNSDFKALLTTPRTAGGGAQQQQREGSSFKHPRPKAPADPDRDKKFKKPHPKRPGKPGAAGDKQKEGEEGPLYRSVPLGAVLLSVVKQSAPAWLDALRDFGSSSS
jgi:hypothetical protein